MTPREKPPAGRPGRRRPSLEEQRSARFGFLTCSSSHLPPPPSPPDDAYTYGSSHTYGMFRPSMPSFNRVNDAEVFNGFGMQSHPNVENRSLGCDERAVYEETLQNFYAAYQSGKYSTATWPSRGWTVGSVFTSERPWETSRYMAHVVLLAVVMTLYTIEVATIAAMVVFSHCPPAG